MATREDPGHCSKTAAISEIAVPSQVSWHDLELDTELLKYSWTPINLY